MLYRIGWSPVDVSVQPSEQSVGKRVRIWVHTDPHTALTISLRFPKGLVKQFSSTTGKRGWASVRYRIGRYLKSGTNHTVVVRASAVTGGAMHRAKTTFRIM
jgi:hypothetical protein